MADEGAAARSALSRARSSQSATQDYGSPSPYVAIELTTNAPAPAKQGVALITLTGYGVQFTAPAKVVVVPATTLLTMVGPVGRLPVGVPPALLKSPAGVRFYGFTIGDAQLFTVGFPETPEADAAIRGLPAPAALAVVPATTDMILLDLDDAGNVATGKASQ